MTSTSTQVGYYVGLVLLATMGSLLYVITMQILPVVIPSSHVHPGEESHTHEHAHEAKESLLASDSELSIDID